jgi:hypothetical protein
MSVLFGWTLFGHLFLGLDPYVMGTNVVSESEVGPKRTADRVVGTGCVLMIIWGGRSDGG